MHLKEVGKTTEKKGGRAREGEKSFLRQKIKESYLFQEHTVAE